MPLYELLVLSRAATSSTVPPRAQSLSLTHPAQKDLQQAIKRTAVRLIEGNAILRTLDYLGTQRLPYRMKLQEKFVYDASYWQICFFANPRLLEEMRYHLRFDADIVRYTLLKKAHSLKGFVQP